MSTAAPSIELLGVRVTPRRFDSVVEHIVSVAGCHDGGQVRGHFLTVHSLVEATRTARLRDVFATAQLACTDGVPLVWLSHRRGAPCAERCAGPDTMLAVCDQGRPNGLRHFFLGGAPGTPERLAQALTLRLPGLKVAGTLSPPFRELSIDEQRAIVEAINAAHADVLWIGLGSPKQDFWAADHAAELDVPVILAVGAAFDFHSGKLRRAPRWMQRLGLEWLFRLAMEPRRLAPRYITTNSRFIWLVIRDALRRGRPYSAP